MWYNKHRMKKFVVFIFLLNLWLLNASNAASMFDDSGNYSGNWKQMTNVSSSSRHSYSSAGYSSASWYANNQKQKAINNQTSYSAQNYTQQSTLPYRYNTLNYTRVRKVKGGYGDYNAKCSDIGDVSFCR